MNEVESKWFGWIPTNRGRINFDFIELPEILKSKNVTKSKTQNKIKFENLDASYLSDSYAYRAYRNFLKVEYPATANIEFEYKSNEIQGFIEIIYKDFCKLKSKFVCGLNGVVAFENISYDIDSIEDVLHEIKSLFYILVKTVIHGDAHHHQKIDIALPIIDNKFNNKFNPSEISSSLLDYIKLVERNVKNTKDCASLFRNENLSFEINGYLSYFKSFTLLFEDGAVNKNYEFAKSVVDSLKNTVAKRKNKAEFKNQIKTAVITFLGLFISINILLNGFWKQDNSNIVNYLSSEDRFWYLLYSVGILLVLFYKYINCKIHSYLHHYKYNFYEFSKLIKNANFFDLNWKGKFYKLLPLFIIAISIAIIFFSRMQDVSHIQIN